MSAESNCRRGCQCSVCAVLAGYDDIYVPEPSSNARRVLTLERVHGTQ